MTNAARSFADTEIIMAIDHTNCDHPRTPAGRRACRSGGTTPAPRKTGTNDRRSLGEAERNHDEASGLVRRKRTPQAGDAQALSNLARMIHGDMSREAVIEDAKAVTPAPIRRARAKALQDRLMAAADGPRVRCAQAALHTGKGRCACGWSA